MQILRHEAGHAIDTAYRLHRRRRWQDVFGSSSQPYPDHYQPKPYSKSYVRHLDIWYAQSHPDEDFAETFAVWVKPRSNWRTQYEGWPALEEAGICRRSHRRDPRRRRPRSPRENGWTRCAPCARRCEPTTRRSGPATVWERTAFMTRSCGDCSLTRRNAAATPVPPHFCGKSADELRQVVAEWTGQYQYTIDQVLSEMIAPLPGTEPAA